MLFLLRLSALLAMVYWLRGTCCAYSSLRALGSRPCGRLVAPRLTISKEANCRAGRRPLERRALLRTSAAAGAGDSEGELKHLEELIKAKVSCARAEPRRRSKVRESKSASLSIFFHVSLQSNFHVTLECCERRAIL